jgi:hypothetical protein
MTLTLSAQLADLAWKDAWLHELRAPDGKWVHGTELGNRAQHVPAGDVNVGDGVLAYGHDNLLKPMRVRMVGPHNGHLDLFLADTDDGFPQRLHLAKGQTVQRVGVANQEGETVPTISIPGEETRYQPPKPTAPPSDPVHSALAKAQAKLEADTASGVRSVGGPHAGRGMEKFGGFFGNTADTSVITFNSGHKWIRKRDLPSGEVSNEVLASRVGAAVGTHAPVVFRHPDVEAAEGRAGPQPIWEPFASGNPKPAIEWIGGVDENYEPLGSNDENEMYQSPQGRRIGILDTLTGNGDRHYGNWMVGHSATGDYPIPIDHGGAGAYAGAYARADSGYGSGPFGEALMDGGADTLGRITPEEWAQMEKNLQAVKPDFQEEGRADEFATMMAAFGKLRESSDDYREGGFA